MKEKIKQFAKTLQIEYLGIASAEPMEELAKTLTKRRMQYGKTGFEEEDISKRTIPSRTLPNATSIIVCLFPYFHGKNLQGNLSAYAQIPDYHVVVMERLQKICAFILKEKPDANLMPFVDSGPLADKYLAYQAGLGFFGKNTLLINEKYGSYVFVGYIITDLELSPDVPLESACGQCDACIRNCPGGALHEGEGLCPQACVSYITQLKTISAQQETILEKQASVYGCDICQEVCPHNANIPMTPITEFQVSLLQKLEKETLSAMSNREFRLKYQKYPFSWRGKGAILKNFRKKS